MSTPRSHPDDDLPAGAWILATLILARGQHIREACGDEDAGDEQCERIRDAEPLHREVDAGARSQNSVYGKAEPSSRNVF